MTGLDKIINEIKEESDQTAAEIMKTGQQKASEITSAAEQEINESVKEIESRAEASVKQINQRAADGADLIKKRAILAAKQEIIGETLAAAKQKLYSMDDASYAGFIEKLIIANACDGTAEVSIGKEDEKRLPSGFIEKVGAKLPVGKTLRPSGKSADTDHGVILSYEGASENLSIDELFASKSDELTDLVKGILF